MEMKFKLAYMDTAKRFAELSRARRKKVGAIIVKDDRILSIGYNGTPSGWDNDCEYEIDGEYVTKREVLHAEANALAKLTKSTENSTNAMMFVTLSPCFECSKNIYSAGISKVYYSEEYRDISGIKFLEQCGVIIEKI
jgi:dCMP deaminase